MSFLHILVIILSWTTVTAPDTDCPELKGCTCTMEPDWLTGNKRYIVNCSQSALKSIPDFKSLTKSSISKLLLNHNNISRITKEHLCGIDIEELDLSHNPLQSFANNTFTCLISTLKVLSLEYVGLNINTDLAFLKGLRTLRELNLGSNNNYDADSTLTKNMFFSLGLYSLKKINLANCQLSGMNISALSGLEGLEEFILQYNYFENIPYEIKRLSNLRHLNLYGNELTVLSNGSFSTLLRLEKLNIGSNEIYSVHEEAFRGLENGLVELELNDNELTSVPSKALKNLRLLSTLNLAMNFIEEVEDNAFVGHYHIKELILDGNRIQFSPRMFHGMENSLQSLRIRNMGLTSFPLASLNDLKQLKTLDLAQNRIKDIQKGFMKGLSIESLYLPANDISYLSLDVFSDLSRQLDIDMTSNKISNISFILYSKPCTIRNIDVSDNPVVCDCALEQIQSSGIVSSLVEGECLFHGGKKPSFYSDDVNGMLSKMCQISNRKYNCFTGTTVNSCPNVHSSFPFVVVLILIFLSIVKNMK